MRASEFIIESQNAADVLKYVKSIHHDFHLDDTILTHPRWELKRVPLNQLHVPDPESGEDLDDPYNRVQMIDMYHVDDITTRDIESRPIVVDTDGFIIDGNHRALAARLSGMKDIPAYVPVEVNENFADGRKPGRKGLAKRMGVDCKQSISKLRNIAKNSSGERQRMAHWCANMKSGQQKESQEHIAEIERIPNVSFRGGKDHLEGERPGKVIKRLPGNSGFLYSIQSSRSSMKIAILDPENPQSQNRHGTPVALLTLSAERKFPGGAWRVDTITVDEEYRGAGLAKSLYGIVLAILKQTLVAGDMQTPGGRRNWVSLSQISGVDVLGYVAISTYNLTNSDINTIMGKLGGQHLGKYGSYMYFAFPVTVNSTGKELEAIVKTKLSKVYGTDAHAEVGLFATWTGK